MNPLTNAVLGVAFLVVGAAATLLMYWQRGRPHQAQQEPEAEGPSGAEHP